MTCEHCGAALAPIAQFCGRCGRSVGVVPPPPVFPRAEDVREVAREEVADASPEAQPAVTPDDAAAVSAAPFAAPSITPFTSAPHDEPPSVELLPCAVCGTRPEPADRFCGECGEALGSPVPPSRAVDVPAVSSPSPWSVPERTPELAAELAPEFAHEAPPAPIPATAPERPPVILQFSTGESVSVLGSGLLGRNPRPEPGEVVDHVVIVTDPTRSVSKTHLEFGFDADAFWVSDRHSGNGTVIREPGQLPRYCEPGRRYHVARGTRVDMGDQFVIIG